jgi:hypothetical protein
MRQCSVHVTRAGKRPKQLLRIPTCIDHMNKMSSEAGTTLACTRWNNPEVLAERREARRRRLAADFARFPVTPAEAEQIRALLPPVTEQDGDA